jgi:exosome complex RNA-binding protein Csl4
LGVLVAEQETTGKLMLPFDWTTMVEPEELGKEKRKVCKPE